MIRVTGTLTCATLEDAALVAVHLPDHIRLSRAEPGCLRFDVTATADPLVWALDECFVDRDGLAAHQARTKASPWFAHTRHLTRDFQTLETL